MATQFYNDRIGHTFQRFARIGRDFYALEQRWSAHHFWRSRAVWPDREPAHSDLEPAIVAIEKKPVVDNYQIQLRDVVVTSDQPLGVWHLNGIELAPVVTALRKAPPLPNGEWHGHVPSLVNRDPGQVAAVTAWLVKYGVIAQ